MKFTQKQLSIEEVKALPLHAVVRVEVWHWEDEKWALSGSRIVPVAYD